jgi:hypothetical protein
LEYPKDPTWLDPFKHLLKIRTCGTKWKKEIDKTNEWAVWQWVITYLGSGICSYSLTKDEAIFIVTVPAVIIRSACLGLDLGTKP